MQSAPEADGSVKEVRQRASSGLPPCWEEPHTHLHTEKRAVDTKIIIVKFAKSPAMHTCDVDARVR